MSITTQAAALHAAHAAAATAINAEAARLNTLAGSGTLAEAVAGLALAADGLRRAIAAALADAERVLEAHAVAAHAQVAAALAPEATTPAPPIEVPHPEQEMHDAPEALRMAATPAPLALIPDAEADDAPGAAPPAHRGRSTAALARDERRPSPKPPAKRRKAVGPAPSTNGAAH